MLKYCHISKTVALHPVKSHPFLFYTWGFHFYCHKILCKQLIPPSCPKNPAALVNKIILSGITCMKEKMN